MLPPKLKLDSLDHHIIGDINPNDFNPSPEDFKTANLALLKPHSFPRQSRRKKHQPSALWFRKLSKSKKGKPIKAFQDYYKAQRLGLVKRNRDFHGRFLPKDNSQFLIAQAELEREERRRISTELLQRVGTQGNGWLIAKAFGESDVDAVCAEVSQFVQKHGIRKLGVLGQYKLGIGKQTSVRNYLARSSPLIRLAWLSVVRALDARLSQGSTQPIVCPCCRQVFPGTGGKPSVDNQ